MARKEQTGPSYKRMVAVALDPRFSGALGVGLASHNLFEVAWAAVAAEIERLGATSVVVLGGETALSKAVEDGYVCGTVATTTTSSTSTSSTTWPP